MLFVSLSYITKTTCKHYYFSVNSDDFKAGVVKLAKMLNVVNHPDHLVTLRAISKLVRTRLNPDALAKPETVVIKVYIRDSIQIRTTT